MSGPTVLYLLGENSVEYTTTVAKLAPIHAPAIPLQNRNIYWLVAVAAPIPAAIRITVVMDMTRRLPYMSESLPQSRAPETGGRW